MADYSPVYGKPQEMTFTAGAAITGGQLVMITAADTVAPCNATTAAVGVASHDAASGAKVTVAMGSGLVHETNASVAVPTAGVALYPDAAGGVTPTSGTAPIVGYAVRTALIATNVRWKSVG